MIESAINLLRKYLLMIVKNLLLLKDMINTETAKKTAMHRQAVMEDFLEEFMAEWEGEK